MTPERCALQMGLDLPDSALTGYCGAADGAMTAYHLAGSRDLGSRASIPVMVGVNGVCIDTSASLDRQDAFP